MLNIYSDKIRGVTGNRCSPFFIAIFLFFCSLNRIFARGITKIIVQ